MKLHTFSILKTCVSRITLAASAGFIFIFAACQEKPLKSDLNNGPSIEEIQHIYGHYIKGQYSDYIKHVASCKNKPRFYREQIINLYRQHDEQRKLEVGNIDSISVRHIEISPHAKHAKVFLIHHYQKAAPEEIILQMVYDEGAWHIK